ncbi:MAG: SDR family NAD(P)-dependent oxidoreductase [Opitutaceae bacterium]
MSPSLSAPTGPSRPVAIITGASSGIGEVFARKLAPYHDLILVARRAYRLEAVAVSLRSAAGAQVEVLPADLGREDDLARVADRVATEPRLALLVNNAGFGLGDLFWKTPIEGLERMHRLHVLATLRLCHAALGNLVPRNRGAIVNVASVAAFVRGVGSGGYGATKSWMTAFTEGLHLDLRSVRSSVTVQALCPGFTYSEFHDTMGVDRRQRAPKWLWLSAERVVDASLAGLRRGRLYVIPSRRYRLLVAIASALPTPFRLALEGARRR